MASRMGTAIERANGDQLVISYLRADYWSRASKTSSAREAKARERDGIWQQLNYEQRKLAGELLAYIKVRR